MAATLDTTDTSSVEHAQMTSNEEVSAFYQEMKTLVVQMMKASQENVWDDKRKALSDQFKRIPDDDTKFSTLYAIFKDKSESDELRSFIICKLYQLTYNENILSSLGTDRFEMFRENIIEDFKNETSESVKESIALAIGEIGLWRKNDNWLKLEAFLDECSSSDEDSLKEMALALMWRYKCKSPSARKLMVESILGTNPSLRKPAIRALHINHKDDESMEFLLPALIKIIDKGCCAVTMDNGLPSMECYGEHAVALDCLRGIENAGCLRDETSITNRIFKEQRMRIVAVATQIILNREKCENRYTHRTALGLIERLIYRHAEETPTEIIPDIISSGLLVISSQLSRELKEWIIVNPAMDEPFECQEFMIGLGVGFMAPLLERTDGFKIAEFILAATEALFKSDDWTKRAAAVIGWSVLYREWDRPRPYFLVHFTEGCLSDEHPRVREIAANLFAKIARDLPPIDGNSSLSNKLVSDFVSMVCEKIPQVRASAIFALSSIRSTTDYLSPFYSVLLPLLLSVVSEFRPNSPREVHAQCVIIITNLAVAVGPDRFMRDFAAVEQSIIPLLSSMKFKNETWHFGFARAIEKLCDLVGHDCELGRTLASYRPVYYFE